MADESQDTTINAPKAEETFVGEDPTEDWEPDGAIEEHEIVTEADAFDPVTDGVAVLVPIVPDVMQYWFTQYDGNDIIVTEMMGQLGISEGQGDDVSLTDDEPLVGWVVDAETVPFTDESIDALEDYFDQ